MLNDTIIVQSAISAFNNAALAAPAFLWWAILMLPLFWMVRMFGGAFLERIGWTRENMVARASMTTVVMTLIWTVLFGGNYIVLRDGVSLLPFMTAAILFISTLFIGANTRDVAIPKWRAMSRRQRVRNLITVLCLLAVVGLSDMHAWWGPVLQIGAFVAGLLIGRRFRRINIGAIPGAICVMMAVTTVILMQPEFFRFGQLGNLTVFHLIFVMLTGATAAAAVVARYVNPRGRIHRSAYVKLKWMTRFVVLLGLALFLLTESVPVFLGTTVALMISFALTVWHAQLMSPRLGERMFAATMMVFGVITVMPVIAALGLALWGNGGTAELSRDARFLL